MPGLLLHTVSDVLHASWAWFKDFDHACYVTVDCDFCPSTCCCSGM